MKRFLILLPLVIPFCVFSQSEKNFGTGVQLSTVFETMENHGLQPSFLLNFRGHECVFGPRIGLERILYPANGAGKKYQALGADFAYRYFVPLKISGIRPFATVMFNYFREYSRTDRYYVYDPNDQVLYGPSFGHSFNLREEHESKTYGLYFGPGIEVRLRKKLFLNASGGPGFVWRKYEYKYTDRDSGEAIGESRSKWIRYKDWNWSGNLGLAYRF